MSKDKTETPVRKGGKMKKLLLISVGAAVLIGAGAGAGIYMGGGLAAEATRPEDRFPKLVVRSATAEATAATGSKKQDAPPTIRTSSGPHTSFMEATTKPKNHQQP